MKKRIISTLLVITQILMIIPVAAYAGGQVIPFPDVEKDSVYAEGIEFLHELGVVSGDLEGNFRPSDNVNRSELAKMLYMVLNGTEKPVATESKYTDVAINYWYNPYANWVASKRLILPAATDKFAPKGEVTVEELARIIVTVVEGKPLAGEYESFTDKVAALGLFGEAEKPEKDSPATRELAAFVLYNILELDCEFLDGATPIVASFPELLEVASTKNMMLVSTYTNNVGINDGTDDYDGVHSVDLKSISLAELGLSTYTDTLKTAKNYKYYGRESIDDLVGLPVTVSFDKDGNVLGAELFGTAVTCNAGDLVTKFGQYYMGDTQIRMDWNRFNFDSSHNSPRLYTIQGNLTYMSNWSGANRLFDTYTDERVTLVDTDKNGKYDWMLCIPIWNGLEIKSIEEGILKTSNNPVGSWQYTGWPMNPNKFETDDVIKVGDYVNIRYKSDGTAGNQIADRNGAPLYNYAYVTKAEVVTGKLERINKVSSLDMRVTVDGKEYTFTKYISKSAGADGADGINSGRLDVTLDKIGTTVTLVLDESGNVVRFLAKALEDADIDKSAEVGYTSYQTENGTMIAAVLDIQPILSTTEWTRDTLERRIAQLAEVGFTRVYCVLCNPGYPMFSVASISPFKGGNIDLSVRNMGDANKVFVDLIHKYGMEAIGVIKPYEGGGQISVPESITDVAGTVLDADVGGNRMFFETFISETIATNDMRTKRKDDGAWIVDTTKAIDKIEVAFMLDSYSYRNSSGYVYNVQSNSAISLHGIAVNKQFNIWVSKDNGKYELYNGPYNVDVTTGRQDIISAGGYKLIDNASVAYFTVSGLEIPGEYKYVAISFQKTPTQTTLPYSMIKIYSGDEELPCTVGKEVRQPRDAAATPSSNIWGRYATPISATEIDGIQIANGTAVSNNRDGSAFVNWGFEFNWHGQGHSGDGWCKSAVYGIARGKSETFAGSLCEAYPEVREYWLDNVERALDQGYDGIDIRLQSHSSMILDYMSYGYNEPIVEAYKKRYGKDISKGVETEEEYIQLMEIRGEFFMLFLEDVRELCDKKDKVFAMHLREFYTDLELDEDFNEVALWCMPKITLDWKALVDLCDEVTIKDYFYGNYNSGFGREIREYAQSVGKPVWIHAYMQQAGNLSNGWIFGADYDSTVDGVMLYEIELGSSTLSVQLAEIKASLPTMKHVKIK